MKKGIAPVAVMAVMILAVAAVAVAHRPDWAPKEGWRGFHGKGFAVSTSDPASFEQVAIKLKDSADDGKKIDKGSLKFGDERLAVRNASKVNGTISGDLYRNETKAGSFSITKTGDEPNQWYGSLSLDGKDYRLYIFGHMHRHWKPIPILGGSSDDGDLDDGKTRGSQERKSP